MKFTTAALAATAALAFTASANAGPDLVTNGGFEATTAGAGQLGFNTNATGWTVASGGYTFLYASGTADTTGSDGQYGNVSLWGPNNGSANGLPASSPAGGNFVGEDSDFQVVPITQTLNGLTVGDKYTVNFYWAGAQQSGFTGASTDQFIVGFGGSTQSTAMVDVASEGFSGWQHQSFTFTADNTSDVLSFLASGSVSGVPSFALLEGVSVFAAAPEPATWALMLVGVGSLGAASRMRRRNAARTIAG
jgi:hypothetical protein